MANSPPKLTAEQRRAAAGQFERANQVLKAGDLDYGLQLLLTCCTIDPGNLIYRQALRQTQRAKYKNNGHGQTLASLRSLMGRFRLRRAIQKDACLDALVQAEVILMRNPWDLPTHLAMAEAFEELGLQDHALWTLEQIRPNHPQNPKVNRPLARLYEKRGKFNQAIALWELVRLAIPDDQEAAHKAKDLAASATIAKGRYEEVIKGTAQPPSAQTEQETAMAHSLPDGTMPPSRADTRQPREVAALLEKIQKNPNNPNGYLQLSNVYRKAEELDKAQEILRQGLAPTANSFDITQELLDLEIEPLRHDLAIAEERLRKNANDAGLQQISADLAKEINSRELDYHRCRSDRYPSDTAARFEMALRLMRAGQLDEAIKELQMLRADPRHQGKALYYLGLCFKSRKNWRLAQRNLEESLRYLLETDNLLKKDAMFSLAVGSAEAGDMNRAVDIACELANLDFNYKNIGVLLDEWQTNAGK